MTGEAFGPASREKIRYQAKVEEWVASEAGAH